MPKTELASTDSKIKFESSAKGNVLQSVKRKADPEYDDVLASAKVRKGSRVKPASQKEIIELSDTE